MNLFKGKDKKLVKSINRTARETARMLLKDHRDGDYLTPKIVIELNDKTHLKTVALGLTDEGLKMLNIYRREFAKEAYRYCFLNY